MQITNARYRKNEGQRSAQSNQKMKYDHFNRHLASNVLFSILRFCTQTGFENLGLFCIQLSLDIRLGFFSHYKSVLTYHKNQDIG